MAKSGTSSTTARAHRIAREGTDVQRRIHDLTVQTVRTRKLSTKDLSGVFNQILEGARHGVSDALPRSQKNVLRQVVEGLGEASAVIAHTSAGALREAKSRGRRIATKEAAGAARTMQDASRQFLGAAQAFACRLRGEVREEVEDVIARARRAAPKVSTAARGTKEAADGHILELTGEAARAGGRLARGAFSGLMMAAGGLLEGLGESAKPRKASPAPRQSRSSKSPRSARSSSARKKRSKRQSR